MKLLHNLETFSKLLAAFALAILSARTEVEWGSVSQPPTSHQGELRYRPRSRRRIIAAPETPPRGWHSFTFVKESK
ncbi:hypothetical protein [Duganella sp. BuS-21]|uniref:hypothetical protein n=1 Tax=Duganella sp. BuS-21 TaxID=2943848 RepID=UPI0035A649B3